MADYWVSNKKKFCEICKVWFADNKVSIENHERGLKHKGMIQQRLREMSKKSKEVESKQGHINATLIAMEQAALAAMQRDGQPIPSTVASSATSTAKVVPKPFVPKVDPKQEAKERKRKIKELKKTAKQSQLWNSDSDFIEWVQSEANGQTYYWNIFTQETAWDAPNLFYTTAEYTSNYEEISKKVEELSKSIAAVEAQVEQPPPPPEEPDQTAETKKKTESKDCPEKKKKKETWFDKHQVKKELEKEFKKHLPSQAQQSWDVRKLVSADVVETTVEEDDSTEGTSKYVEKYVEKPSSGLGPWIPIVKAPISTTELQKQDAKKVVLDDLPEQSVVKKPSDSVFDEDDQDAEITFQEKVLPVPSLSKKSKPVFFRKTKSKAVKREE